MFTFKLSNLKEPSFNYPKYTIILKSEGHRYFHDDIIFYYLVSWTTHSIRLSNKCPNYMVMPSLYFNVDETNEKFNLSKLGTDYLINGICIHYREECIGSYPDNYIFVNEPVWPNNDIDGMDRSPLKCSKG